MLKLLVISVLFINGLYAIFHRPMIGYKVKESFITLLTRFLGVRLGYQVAKPIISCPICMSSVWGSIIYFSAGNEITWSWPLFLILLSGAIYLIMCLTYQNPLIDEPEAKERP